MDYMAQAVQFLERREDTYSDFLKNLKTWHSVRPKTIAGILDLIEYIDSFHKGANVANIVGSGAGVVGAGAVLLAPFTGGLSLAVGGIVASTVGAATSVIASFKDNTVARENCKKAQSLVDTDGNATTALINSMKEYHELTQKANECLRNCPTSINYKNMPPIVAGSQAATKYLLGSTVIASASALGKGAGKAGARAIPVVSVVCIAIDVWSIVTTTVDMIEGSKSKAGKELNKVIEQLRSQKDDMDKSIIEVIKIQSKNEECTKRRKKSKTKTKTETKTETKTADSEPSDSESSDSDEEEEYIKFCLMNARSVFNKWEIIADYVLHNQIDVLAVTETWDRKEPLVTRVPGYHIFFYSPREDQRGGGVGGLVKETILVVDVKLEFDTFECIKCDLTVPLKDGSFDSIHTYIIYKPPYSTSTNESFEHFLDEMQELIALSALENKVIFMGDFNLHWQRNNSEKARMQSLLNLNFLYQHVDEATHKNHGTLDWVITRFSEVPMIEDLYVDNKINQFKNINLDHYPVIFKVILGSIM